jgi:hypothetical protein
VIDAMPMHLSKRIAWTVILLAPLSLAGCATERSLFTGPFAPTSAAPAAPPQPAAPPINMAGRWMLASPDGRQCGMTFTAPPGAASGRIAPEGGCPGNFFTSRQWAFDRGALVIYDHKEQALARLAASEPPGRFEGTAASGISVNLSR